MWIILFKDILYNRVIPADDAEIKQLKGIGRNGLSFLMLPPHEDISKSMSKENASKLSMHITANKIVSILEDPDIKLGDRNILAKDIAILVKTNNQAHFHPL